MTPRTLLAAAMALLLLGLVRACGRVSAGVVAPAFGVGLGHLDRLAHHGRLRRAHGARRNCACVRRAGAQRGLRPAGAQLGRFVLAMLPWLVLPAVIAGGPGRDRSAQSVARAGFAVLPEDVVPSNSAAASGHRHAAALRPTLPRCNCRRSFPCLHWRCARCAGSGGPARRCANRRAMLLAVALAALLPIAVTILARPAMYNGIRHSCSCHPLAVPGRRRLARRVSGAARTACGDGRGANLQRRRRGTSPTWRRCTLRIRVLQPARRRRARARPAATCRLLGAVVQTGRTRTREAHRRKLARDRRWLAVCGPRRSRKSSSVDFETTWEPQGADFAMMLAGFYCATFDARCWSGRHDGVVYARIYDLRGRLSNLLAMPDN